MKNEDPIAVSPSVSLFCDKSTNCNLCNGDRFKEHLAFFLFFFFFFYLQESHSQEFRHYSIQLIVPSDGSFLKISQYSTSPLPYIANEAAERRGTNAFQLEALIQPT